MKKRLGKLSGLWMLLNLFSFGLSGQTVFEPYLQKLSSTGITVRWNSEMESIGKIWYGTDIENLSELKTENDSAKFHIVSISSLKANAKYYYTLDGMSSNDELFFVTSPDIGTRDDFRFWVISDFGQTSYAQNEVRIKNVENWKAFNNGSYNADLVLSLGDQTENDELEELQKTFFEPLYPVLKNTPLFTLEGNHDTHDDLVNYRKTFSMPSNGEAGGYPSGSSDYYSFDYGNVHFIMLSTEIDDINKAQLTWLKKDLNNIPSDKIDWLIACLHRPFHSGGYHETDVSSTAQKQRDYWLTELERGGVDLILQGHNAIYERSFLLNNLIGKTTELNESNIINGGNGREDGDGAYIKPSGLIGNKGTVFIEVAPGGDAVSNNAHYSIFPVTYSGKDIEGSLVIDVEGKKKMKVYFLCYEADGNGNSVRDYFTIIKSDSLYTDINEHFLDPDHNSISIFPNPSCDQVNVKYQLENTDQVSIFIHDVAGHKIWEYKDGQKKKGSYSIQWNAKDFAGKSQPAGIYFVTVLTNNFTAREKFLLLGP